MARLVVALDYPRPGPALDLARQLAALPGHNRPWVKVGLELFTIAGPAVVADLKDLGLPVFLDLKFMDIPNTVRGAVRSATDLGVDMLTLHACGGTAMMEAAVAGRADAAGEHGSGPLLMAVTVLTSMDEADLPPGRSVAEVVADYAARAAKAGLDGVVCSGHEAATVKAAATGEFLCLTPGIRPGGEAHDQRRVMTPARAVAAGSDFLVMGRPVTLAPSPARAAADILAEIASCVL